MHLLLCDNTLSHGNGKYLRLSRIALHYWFLNVLLGCLNLWHSNLPQEFLATDLRYFHNIFSLQHLRNLKQSLACLRDRSLHGSDAFNIFCLGDLSDDVNYLHLWHFHNPLLDDHLGHLLYAFLQSYLGHLDVPFHGCPRWRLDKNCPLFVHFNWHCPLLEVHGGRNLHGATLDAIHWCCYSSRALEERCPVNAFHRRNKQRTSRCLLGLGTRTTTSSAE
mmetsp:Transcript_10340/g.19921  ORF Transcript_10340/g.19921 Transcript_10340/m.19921 type:complete len:220 (-) Transcript_10340:79-738(-)